MQRATASPHLPPGASEPDEELRRVLQQASTEIRRSRNAIGRTADYLAVAERFLTEGGPWLRLHADAVLARRESAESSYAFVHELDVLRGVLTRIRLQVADQGTDLAMEVAELARLSAGLQHVATDPQS
jgi:hypothetical protein